MTALAVFWYTSGQGGGRPKIPLHLPLGVFSCGGRAVPSERHAFCILVISFWHLHFLFNLATLGRAAFLGSANFGAILPKGGKVPVNVPRFRATFFFQDGDYGWTETIWQVVPTTYQDCFSQAQKIGKLRLGMLGTTTTWLALRVSDDQLRRDSYFGEEDLTGAGLGSGKLSLLQTSVQPYSVLLVRQESTAIYRRMIYLAGIPQTVISNPFLVSNIPPAFLAAFNAWRAGLLSPGPDPTKSYWGFAATALPPDEVTQAITNIDPATGTVTAPLTFPANSMIEIEKTSPVRPFSGRYIVQTETLNVSMVLKNAATKWAGHTYLMGGDFFLIEKTVVPFTDVFIRGATHRKRGRPFGAPRGRSRAR